MTRVEIGTVNTMPERDPYHADTDGISHTVLEIDGHKATVGQEYDTNSATRDRWHRRTLAARITRVDQADLREYLDHGDGQRLLQTIVDGHTIDWDGNNMVGSLTPEAQAAFTALVDGIDELPESEWSLWSAQEWCEGARDELDLRPTTPDERLESLAHDYVAQAANDHVILDEGEVLSLMCEWRDTADEWAEKELERLKDEAWRSARWRGHKLGAWVEIGPFAVRADCRRCGRGVGVRVYPAPNQTWIAGEALECQ